MTTEKKLCCGIMLCQMSAILSGVALLYLTAIVIVPSKKELEMGFHTTPVMCTTIQAVDIAKLDKKDKTCDWSTCGEWCLSKGSGICMQIRVMVRNNGSKVQLNNCYDIQEPKCSALDPELSTKFRCKKGECKNLEGLYNCSKGDTNDCVEITPAYKCRVSKMSSEVIECTEEKCAKRLEGVYWCKAGKCQHLDNIKKYWTDCQRTCTNLNMMDVNVIVFTKEQIYITVCTTLNSTSNNTINEVSEMQEWRDKKKVLTMFCTYVNKGKGTLSYNIYGEDCFNGTIGNASDIQNLTTYLEILDYQAQLNEYYEVNNNTWVVDDERSLQLMNDTDLLINTEGCVNTLRKECTAFFQTHAHDGSDRITPDRYPCYYTDKFDKFVVGKFEPNFTRLLLLLASGVPGISFVLSCTCLFLCSKAIGVGDDGHLQVNLLSQSNTGGNNHNTQSLTHSLLHPSCSLSHVSVILLCKYYSGHLYN